MNKRDAILETAIRLFGKSGFQATPTSQIAREAGVATGTLFHHFKTKDDLIVELYKSIRKECMLYISKNLRQENDVQENLESIYRDTLRWYAAHPERLKFMSEFESVQLAPLMKDDDSLNQAAISSLLESGKEHGILLNVPVDLMILLIEQHVKAVHLYLQTLSLDEIEREQHIASSFDLVWRMLCHTNA